LRGAMILALVLLSVSSAYGGSSAGSVVVDIVGSEAYDIDIVTSGLTPAELELIGSVTNDTWIGPLPDCPVVCPACSCPAAKSKYPKQTSIHTGVDAWYGTFWYGNINTPRWPYL